MGITSNRNHGKPSMIFIFSYNHYLFIAQTTHNKTLITSRTMEEVAVIIEETFPYIPPLAERNKLNSDCIYRILPLTKGH